MFFVEEPLVETTPTPHLRTVDRHGVTVVTPVLSPDRDPSRDEATLHDLVDHLVRTQRIERPVLWYYTPMALPWTRHLAAAAIVYDSMDYLPGFRGAPPGLLELEDELLTKTDLVFCGGASLHARMVARHPAAHCFPSSVDVAHFRRARGGLADPDDQAKICRPRIGYAGVIDERIDLELIDGVAAARPDLQVVLVGPIAKIDPADLPARPNIHRLGHEGVRGPAGLSRRLGRRLDAVRPKRGDPLYQPNQDAGISRRRSARRVDVDPGRRRSLRQTGGWVAIADSVGTTIGAIDDALAGRRPEPRWR